MTITLRLVKGSALTFAELDGNFTHLSGEVLDLANQLSALDTELGLLQTEFDSAVLLNVANTFTAPQRAEILNPATPPFNLSLKQHFRFTPSAPSVLQFSNIATSAGQSGFLEIKNPANWPLSADTDVKISAADLAAISASGSYLASYFCNGTNVKLVVSGDLT